MAFVITQNEIELVILENDKAYSKQRRFFDSLSSILISTGYFSSVLYTVKNVATDDVEMVLQYRNSNLGIRLRSPSSLIQCVRVDTVSPILSPSGDSSYFTGAGMKTILFRYSETFFQLILIGLSKNAGNETLLINAKVDMPLVKQNQSSGSYDAYGRQVSFNGGVYGISRMTFQNEILLTKPLVYYNDTGKIQDDYDFNNKLFYIDSSFATITTGSLYADNFGTRYLGFSNDIFGYPALIME